MKGIGLNWICIQVTEIGNAKTKFSLDVTNTGLAHPESSNMQKGGGACLQHACGSLFVFWKIWRHQKDVSKLTGL